MKILISAHTYNGFGLGNIYRMLSLYSYLKNHTNWMVDFESSLTIAYDLAKQNGIHVSEPKEDKYDYDVILYDSPYNFLYEKNCKGEKERIMFLKKKTDKLIAFDDCRFEENNSDIAINLYNHNALRINSYKGTIYSGLEYAILKSEIVNAKKRSPNHSDSRKILLTLGGEDPAGITMRIVEQYLKYIDRFTIVIGAAYRKKNELAELVNGRTALLQSINNMGELMQQHDIVICSGGTTLLEALYLQKAIIPIPQSSFEEVFIGNIKSDFYDIADIPSLLEQDISLRCYRNDIVDGKGLERIKNIISNKNKL